MKCAIAVFAKTIGLSPVKTRLFARIGQEKAEAFYRLSIACVKEVLEKVAIENPDAFAHWVLAEEEAPMRTEWNSFPAFWTGEGELGDRLSNVSHQLLKNHDAVFLIGTDSPQMSPDRVLQIIEKLEANPVCQHIVGPAIDGGFWLWGSREALPLEIWQRVPYSTSTTLETLLREVNDHGHHVIIDQELQDVDELKDLLTLQVTLERKTGPLLAAQVELLQWLQEHNPTFQV